MLSAEALSAICVQRFDGSRNSAIHTTYRISLRSSSLREPRYPLYTVVFGWIQRPGRLHFNFRLVLFGVNVNKTNLLARRIAGPFRLQINAAVAPRIHGRPDSLVHSVGIDRFNDPSAGSPTETLLRLLLPLGGRV